MLLGNGLNLGSSNWTIEKEMIYCSTILLVYAELRRFLFNSEKETIPR